jgi:hypothetical protein
MLLELEDLDHQFLLETHLPKLKALGHEANWVDACVVG